MSIVIVGDWDADGVVSTAEVVYAQEYLGIYPLKERRKTVVTPATPRDLETRVTKILQYEQSKCIDALVVLDIAYRKGLENFFKKIRNRVRKVVYIDHHLSTAVHASKLETVTDELIVGKAPTTLLVAHVIKSLGGRLSPRLEAFVRAAAIVEKGYASRRDEIERYRKLVSMVVQMSRVLTYTHRDDVWEKLVRWLASPLSFTAMPFAPDISRTISELHRKVSVDIKSIAMELAPSAKRIFNLRFVDARKVRGVRPSALASTLYRVFRGPVVVVMESRRGDTVLAIRDRGDTPYRLAMKLYEMGIAKDLAGHQSLALVLIDRSIPLDRVVEAIRRSLLSI